jgi:hypothetical protein
MRSTAVGVMPAKHVQYDVVMHTQTPAWYAKWCWNKKKSILLLCSASSSKADVVAERKQWWWDLGQLKHVMPCNGVEHMEEVTLLHAAAYNLRDL